MNRILRHNFFTNLSVWLLIAGLWSCAQRAVLTGGEKDVLPPEIVSALPENQSLNFLSKEIVVEFNEFVRLSNLQNQLIVSPLMKETPEVLIRGKKMVVKLPDELEPNTTYSLNFGDAIIDITENNPYPNYKYVFSTGNYIDSLSYSGKVLNAEDLTPKMGVFVMLYNQLDDSIPLKQKPNYLAKTNAEGIFNITNIANGTYKVFALDDINGNYLYDLPNEQIAFLNKTITLDSTLNNATLFLFNKESTLQFVKKVENKQYGKLLVELNIPSTQLEVFDLEEKSLVFSAKEISTNKLQHTFWLTEEVVESQQSFILKDHGKTIDTTSVEMITKKEFTDTLLSISTNISASFDLNKLLEIGFNQPLAQFDKEKVQLFEDSVLVGFQLKKDSLSALKLNVIYQLKENKDYKLLVEPAALSSVYGLKNDTLISHFKTKKEENYGNLKFTIIPDFKEQYILQLLQNNEVIQEFFDADKKTVNISYLNPGEYQIKLIIDNNSNKKWDTGNYELNFQPERVVLYQDKITIRENWDNEIKWNIKL
ncbi:MAG: Ig-like domain-containing domain [Flavobacteriales bacterium]